MQQKENNLDPQPEKKHFFSAGVEKVLLPLEKLFEKAYGSEFNPLHQSGVLAITLLSVVILTGVYLLFFYQLLAYFSSHLKVQLKF
jgi:hypothetical protein